MASLDYVEIPPYATRLQIRSSNISSSEPAPKILYSLPHPEQHVAAPTTSTALPSSPTKATAFNLIPQLLLSSTLQAEGVKTHPSSEEGKLLTTRHPLSIPMTTVNFRRFVARVGPLNWFQDRVEEIILWKKGALVTLTWMSAYAFICYFPRLILLIPHAIVLGILLATHPSLQSPPNSPDTSSAPPANAAEGSVDWQANLQGIQNLMGALSDLNDALMPLIPHITHASPYTPIIFTLTVISGLVLLLALPFIPLRIMALVGGLTPFVLSHPIMRFQILPSLLPQFINSKPLRNQLTRLIDDDKLEDRHWALELKEVELWENERWSSEAKGGNAWSKTYLRSGERSAWTRGRDGWGGVKEDGTGDVSNLTFSLTPGWAFVETDDWRPDIEATWVSPIGADDGGWVYTNDTWSEPHAQPRDVWLGSGMTRRRRWVRRIYYSPGDK